jgi:hypothetical protein
MIDVSNAKTKFIARIEKMESKRIKTFSGPAAMLN